MRVSVFNNRIHFSGNIHLKIVSWNIRAGGGVRAQGIVDQLQLWQPDIIALSEFRATPASVWIAQRLYELGFQHQRSTADPINASDNALLVASRWPLRRINLATAPSNKKRWLHVNVSAPHTTIALMAMHIPNRSSGLKYPFMESITELVKKWRGPQAVLVGDTNCGCIDIDEESSAFNAIEDQWIKSFTQHQWADAHRLHSGNSREYTWYSPNGGNGFRLDQAFLHPAIKHKLTNFKHIWGGQPHIKQHCLSDHAAIVMELNL